MQTRHKKAIVLGALVVLLSGIALAGFFRYGNPLSQGTWSHVTWQPQATSFISVWSLQRIGEPVPEGISYNTLGLALSPDRQRIATLGDRLQIWDAHSGKRIGSPLAISGGALAWAPDGSTIAAGTTNGSVVLTHAETGRILWQTAIGKGFIGALAFSPNGKYIAARSGDNAVRVLGPAGQAVCQGKPVQRGMVSSLVFAEQGKALVSSSLDGSLRIWDPESCRELRPPIQLGNALLGVLAVHPNGKVVAVATTRGMAPNVQNGIEFWDITTGKTAAPALDGYGWTYGGGGMAFSEDGARLMAANSSGALSYIDWRKGKILARGVAHHDDVIVWKTVFSPQGDLVATAGKDEVLGIWKAQIVPASESPLALTEPNTTTLDAAWPAISRNGQVAAISRGNNVIVRETGSRKELLAATLKNLAYGQTLSADGQWLAASGHHLHLWYLPANRQVGEWDYPSSGNVAFNADASRLAVMSVRSVVLVDCRSGKELARRIIGDNPDAPVSRLLFGPAGKVLLAVNRDGDVYRLDANTLRPLGDRWRGLGGVGALAFSADGSRVAVSRGLSHGNSIQAVVMKATTGEQLSPPMTENLGGDHTLAFTPDGNHLLMAGGDGKVSLWDTRSGQRVALASTGSQSLHRVTFTPDLKYLYACNNIFDTDPKTDCWIWGVSLHVPPATAASHAPAASTADRLSAAGDIPQVSLSSLSGAINLETTDLKVAHEKALTVFLNGSNLRVVGTLKDNPDRAVVYVDSALSTDGRLVTVPLNGEQLAVFDYRSGKLLNVMDNGGMHAFLPEGKLALNRESRAIQVVDAASGRGLRTLSYPTNGRAYLLAAGTRLPVIVIGTSEGTLLFGRADTSATPFKVVKDIHRGAVSALAFSHDERLVASGGIDGRVQAFDAQTGRPVGPISVGPGPVVTALAFNADATLLASGSRDGSIRLWNPKTGQPVTNALLAHNTAVLALWFDPSGNRLLSLGQDSTLNIWALPQGPDNQAGR